jgi:hypothetical protein
VGDWPEPLGPGDVRAFNASLVVPDGAKRVWVEQYLLDTKGLGCWLTHEQLGARLGMSARSVETYRLRLEDAGCVKRLKEPGVRAHGWRSTIPDHCRLRSQRPSPVEVERHRTFIDRHVGGLGIEAGKWPPRPAASEDETRTSAGRNPQSVALKAAPVRVSDALSTAFDSQADSKLSSALDVEGKRDSESHLEARRKAEERPRAEIEAEGLARIRATKATSLGPRDPAVVRAEYLAVAKLQRGEILAPEECTLVKGWLDRQPATRRQAFKDAAKKAVGE